MNRARPPNVLHLAPDEKFIPFVQKCFEEAFPGGNRYRITVAPGGPRYVALTGTVRPAPVRYWFGRQLRADLEWADCLIVHYMTPWFAQAIRRAPRQLTVVWSAWGGDYVDAIPSLNRGQYLAHTRRIVARLGDRLAPAPRGLLDRLHEAVFRAVLPRWDRDVVGRIDAVSTVIPGELELLRGALPDLKAVHHPLLYGCVEDTLAPGPDRVTADDILVGNSATPSNNHAEAFELLRSLDLGDRNVIVPLSYGYPAYADEVTRLGAAAFGSRFVPLRDFVPLEQYNATLARCSTVVMNHVRQQGTGNINTCLYKGAKVYLRPANPLHGFYREHGIRVFELPEPGRGDARFFEPLGSREIDANRAALEGCYAYARAVAAARGLSRLAAARRGDAP